MKDFVDLRSDTVTTPSRAMREAMRDAAVGNAAWGEDPTVRRLEEESAAAVGMEAALFVPSGTMANQVACRVWTSRRMNPEVILEAKSHIYLNESAGLAVVSGAQAVPIPGSRGAMDPAAVEAAIRTDYYLKPMTALVCVENTHNYAGGAVVPITNLRAVRDVAQRHGLPVHLDGARLFNAAAALGVDPARIAEHADSLMFCFSKGLGAPVGSVVCGSAEFVREAERARALLGGAMRQAGVIAAPALLALREGPRRLREDHENARRLAEGLARIDGLALDPQAVETNIVLFDVSALGMSAKAFCERMRAAGAGYSVTGPSQARAVTHVDVDRSDVEAAIALTAETVAAIRKST
ncbi:MAG TPA: GntG family PLP-dependent aldolase [Candidatus Thermoplasmatota archaeon]|nr:GntG family PLP-dependent aldolase [Candidatus Thermoplasmatota archaeon]